MDRGQQYVSKGRLLHPKDSNGALEWREMPVELPVNASEMAGVRVGQYMWCIGGFEVRCRGKGAIPGRHGG